MIDMNTLPLVPLFWDELEEALGPILQPIVGPLFDVLRDDANRLVLLSSIVSICVFFVVITFVVYELPTIFRWLSSGSASLEAASKSAGYSKPGSTPSRVSTTARSARREQQTKASSAEVRGDVKVSSTIEKKRDVTELTVTVTNKSDHQIEMVVVDLRVPEGVDLMTGSFRMQRIGTIPSEESASAFFKLKQNYGSLADISGMVEFMSSSYEITKVDIPSPEIE